MNSPAFRGLTTALLIIMLVTYFINWGGTFYRLYTGQALGVPQQRQEEDEQAKQKKEKMDRYVVRNGSASATASASGSNV
jgi:hypothetical protein